MNYSIHIVIAHYNEDLGWTTNLKYPFTVISKNGLPEDVPPNKGSESSSFLQYIIQNYDNLSNYTVFIHAHRTSWHIVENIDEKINNMIFDKDYYNINDKVNKQKIYNKKKTL